MRSAFLSGVMSSCLALSACGTNNAVVVVANGTMIVDWTIAGTKDPSECAVTGATTIDITVTTTNRVFVGEFQQDCEAFATSISLAPGNYTATAVLLDLHGAARTTSVDIGAFSVLGDSQIVLPINFPQVSFF